MPVTLPAAERAIYLELNQLLTANDFSINKGKFNAGDDRDRRIREVLGTSATAGEALIKCASQFELDTGHNKHENAPLACDVIVALRESQYKSLKTDIQKRLKQAKWLEKNCSSHVRQYSVWKGHIEANQFGDKSCMKEIQLMIDAAELGYKENDWTEFYVTPREKADRENALTAAKAAAETAAKGAKAAKGTKREDAIDFAGGQLVGVDDKKDLAGSHNPDTRLIKPEGYDGNRRMERAALALRDVTNELRKLSTELVSRKRCLRFFKSVRNIQILSTAIRNNEPAAQGCSCSMCRTKNLQTQAISILSQCGHNICKSCVTSHMNRQDDCPAPGCNAVNKGYQVIAAPELGVED
jgi:hypothetical protein